RGELIAAQSLGERGIALTDSQPGSSWAWTFRLLRAESLILQLKQLEAAQDLSDSLPPGREFDWLRARQKYLLARVQIDEGRLQQALETVAEGRRASSLRDVRLDLDVLDGQ